MHQIRTTTKKKTKKDQKNRETDIATDEIGSE